MTAKTKEAPDWIESSRGKRIHPLRPQQFDVDLMEIISVSSKRCRFGGFCKGFYSVAQHSVLVDDLVQKLIDETAQYRAVYAEPRARRRIRLRALFHDAGEVPAGADIPRPFIPHYGKYKLLESLMRERVYDVLGVATPVTAMDKAVVKIADDAALIHEARQLMPSRGEGEGWPELRMSLAGVPAFEALDWRDAGRLMQERYLEIAQIRN